MDFIAMMQGTSPRQRYLCHSCNECHGCWKRVDDCTCNPQESTQDRLHTLMRWWEIAKARREEALTSNMNCGDTEYQAMLRNRLRDAEEATTRINNQLATLELANALDRVAIQ